MNKCETRGISCSRKVLFALLLPLVASCSNQLPTYKVNGKVQFENGNPVIVGIVEFQSVDHRINARGDIQPDGTFQLTTFAPNDGAVAGKHKCVILQMVIGENIVGHKPSTIGVVDSKFASYLTSGLTFDVDPEGINEITVTVHGIGTAPAPGEGHTH